MPEFNNPTTELSYLEKDDVLMAGSPSAFANIKAQNVFSRALTYVQLQALVTASELIPMLWYKITNATSASFNLYVQAVAVNQIGCEAKDPLYPNDVVKYNFGSNVITWRWDTINDISAGGDFRNSNDLQIGANCSKISLGSNCEISIGDNCSNIEVGNIVIGTIGDDCEFIKVGNNIADLSIIATSNNITLEDNCSFIALGVGSNIYLSNNSAFSIPTSKTASGVYLYNSSISAVSDTIQNLTAYNASLDASGSTLLYSLVNASKTIYMNQNGGARLNYINGSNVMVNVDAEA